MQRKAQHIRLPIKIQQKRQYKMNGFFAYGSFILGFIAAVYLWIKVEQELHKERQKVYLCFFVLGFIVAVCLFGVIVATTKLLAVVRGYRDRKAVTKNATKAATQIQAMFRGLRDRRAAAKKADKKAATQIQAVFRRYRDRKAATKNATEKDAAIKLQTAFRRFRIQITYRRFQIYRESNTYHYPNWIYAYWLLNLAQH